MLNFQLPIGWERTVALEIGSLIFLKKKKRAPNISNMVT